MLLHAVANIVEDYVKKTDPEPTPQQVVDYLVHDHKWHEVVRYLRDNEPDANDPVDVRQNKIMARVFNVAVTKTNDFTGLYSMMQQVVKFAYSSGSILDTLDKIKNNQILRYDETKACVQAALNAIKDECVATDSKFTAARNNAQVLIDMQEVAESQLKQATDTASGAGLASVALGLMLLL